MFSKSAAAKMSTCVPSLRLLMQLTAIVSFYSCYVILSENYEINEITRSISGLFF